jgi:hypothetical protein
MVTHRLEGVKRKVVCRAVGFAAYDSAPVTLDMPQQVISIITRAYSGARASGLSEPPRDGTASPGRRGRIASSLRSPPEHRCRGCEEQNHRDHLSQGTKVARVKCL